MRLKKTAIVTAGAAAALLATAPFASATGHKDGHEGAPKPGGPGKVCTFDGGDAGAASEISGDAVAAAVAQAPIAGNNIANLANCSDFLNNSFNDNLSGNTIALF